ncbi:MAG: baseplate J/gp47 family protein [Treponema sp.]|nr:baseplate J/gp47 family protein [Treponema sp.]
MSFKRDSLATLLDRVYANYTSLFRPLDKTPRQNLLKVFASVEAGIYHQLLGDLDFLSKQIFPDTAEGAYLREHWSIKIVPLYAIAALGEVKVTGQANKPVPSGVVFQAASGERYYQEKSYRLDASGRALITVKAENPGTQGNLAAGEKLSVVSAIPLGVDSEAVVSGNGISGGSDAESDEEYLVRVLAMLRNPSRYGRRGDFALWARDASAEVSAAWEFKNFGVFGTVLVQVINGNQINGVYPVDNLAEVRNYISEVAPPVLFEVRTPAIIPVNPSASLPPQEDSQENRELAVNRIKTYMQFVAYPGARITAGALRLAAIDGVTITDITVSLGGSTAGIMPTTILEYPYIGEVSWD